jgi:excinuclease UvrABC nuclease subunit
MKSARLNFRPAPQPFLDSLLGSASAWPEWVQAAAGKSGVYIIRARDGGRILYVGESHTGRLKKTLLRHFQAWSGKTAGKTYGRNAVEIALEITPADRAVARQNKLIADLDPRDNEIDPAGDKSEDSNPF